MSLPFPEEQDILLGHEDAEKTFLNLYQNKTLAGSWLICGNRGIGKATLAYRLARFLLSQNKENDSGGLFGNALLPTSLAIQKENLVFKEVAMRSNPDLKVIEPSLKEKEVKERQALIDAGKPLDLETERKRAKNDEIRIDEIRALSNFMHLTSATGGWRVIIFDCADDMNDNASNSLLKFLEEPKDKTLFLLISHHPSSLLPTIRSRCRKIQLKPLSDENVKKLLTTSYPELNDAEKKSLCVLAEGSIGTASFLAENNGSALYQSVLGLFKHFPDFSVPDLYDFVEQKMKDKNKVPMIENLFLLFLMRATRYAVTPDSMQEACENEFLQLRQVTNKIEIISFLDKIESIKNAFKDTDLDYKQLFINACTLLADGVKK